MPGPVGQVGPDNPAEALDAAETHNGWVEAGKWRTAIALHPQPRRTSNSPRGISLKPFPNECGKLILKRQEDAVRCRGIVVLFERLMPKTILRDEIPIFRDLPGYGWTR